MIDYELLFTNMFANLFIDLPAKYFLSKFKKKFLKIKCIIIVFILIILLVFKIFHIFPFSNPYPHASRYPFEENQTSVNGLLTNDKLNSILEPFYLNQNQIECKNETFILIAINSGIENFNKRQMIRETWANWVNNSNQTLYFFISKPRDQFSKKKLKLENEDYKDLIFLPVEESYYLLSFKVLSILKWSTDHCPNIKFVIKCDDDMFVNWPNLNEFLISNQNQTNLIFGKANEYPEPNRDETSRWYIPYEEYSKDYYPEYVAGPIYIISSDLIPKLLYATSKVKPIYLEDVYITGILRERIVGAKLELMKNLFYQPYEPIDCWPKSVYSFHNVTTNQMEYLFKNFSFNESDSSVLCSFSTLFY